MIYNKAIKFVPAAKSAAYPDCLGAASAAVYGGAINHASPERKHVLRCITCEYRGMFR